MLWKRTRHLPRTGVPPPLASKGRSRHGPRALAHLILLASQTQTRPGALLRPRVRRIRFATSKCKTKRRSAFLHAWAVLIESRGEQKQCSSKYNLWAISNLKKRDRKKASFKIKPKYVRSELRIRGHFAKWTHSHLLIVRDTKAGAL